MHDIIDIPIPDSPRSDFSGSPPSLNPATLALLDDFLSSKAEEERRFQQLMAERDMEGVTALQDTSATRDKAMMSVDEYRLAFGEDWQLSQFW